ncbi:DUF3037 domain-containing protein [Galenea microaerophila]
MFSLKKNTKKQNLIRCHWALIQISPNVATQERINVGVALIDQDGVVYVRLAKDLSKLKCLYKKIDVKFFEECLSYLQFIMHGARVESLQELNVFEGIYFSDLNTAKGERHEQILSHLFEQMVALG